MRYAKYKETGIAWLPEVPEGWEMRPLKEMVSCNDEAISESDTAADTEIQYVEIGDVEFSTGISNITRMKFADAPSRARRKTRVGDVIVSTVRTYLRAVAKIARKNLIVSTGFAVLRPRTVSSDYLSYACASTAFTDQVIAESTGISYPAISSSKLMRCRIPLPPLPTQRAIVAFLDDKCGKVDRLVVAKEKEVALLKELKQSVIAEAVTRGLRDKVEKVGGGGQRKFKPSGIPWLPELPEGWEVRRAKYLFQKEQRPVQEGDEIVTCFRDGEVTLRKNRRLSGFTEATDYSHYQHICAGDLVIHQMDAFAGSCGVSDSDGMGTPVLSVCTPKNDQLDVRYFAAVIRLMGLNGFIQSLYRGIRERSSDFRFETFAKQFLPIPPLAEQREIVAYIEARAAKIDAAVAGLEKEIAALKEYKQRLIADVVTGQRKVA